MLFIRVHDLKYHHGMLGRKLQLPEDSQFSTTNWEFYIEFLGTVSA